MKKIKEYIKSLFPWRWIIPVLFISLWECLLILTSTIIESINIFYFIGFGIYWIILDFTIGLGRSEKNEWLNLIGIIVTLITLYIWIITPYKDDFTILDDILIKINN